MSVFRSKVDVWLAVLLVAAMLGCVVAVVAVAMSSIGAALIIGPLVLAPGIGLPLWLLMETRYTLGESALEVRSGPFSWRVPYAEIRAVVPTRNPLSSPALSLDRLRIDYGRVGSIMISPADKARFLEQLDARRGQASGEM